MNEPLNAEGTPAVAVQRVVIPPPADTRQRIVTATITLRVGTFSPERMVGTAQRRKDDLKAWLDRHWRDIENDVPSQFDDMSYEVGMDVEEPQDSAV